MMVERMNEINNLKAYIRGFVKEEEFNKLLKRFDVFSEIENIERLNHYLIPKLEKFSLKTDELLASNIEMRECVQKFDEVLSMKASKSEFQILQKSIEMEYMNNNEWKTINKMYSDLKEQFDGHDACM